MKFTGELKFPEIDHPGVPVQFVIEGTQAELLVEGESLGRWSLYDLRARRLVASAFQIDLDGTEVTFVADDPIDFAYRGVEHMAETWATLKSKRIASRGLAVRKSRKGTTPSRIEDMKTAMLANLEGQGAPRALAGEVVMPGTAVAPPEDGADDRNWDLRGPGSIPVVGEEPVAADEPESMAAEEPETAAPASGPDTAAPASEPDSQLQDQLELIEEEKRRLAAEWERLEEERRLAERREEDRLEAYRLEMERLRAEREQLRHLVGTETEQPVFEEPFVEEPADQEPVVEQPEPAEETSIEEPAPVEPVVEEPVVEEPVAEEPADEKPVAESESEERVVEELADEEAIAEPEPVEPEPEEPEPAVGLVDLNDLEDEPEQEPEPVVAAPTPVAASAGAARERSGLMGAVRAAFRSGSRDHAHQFIEAPGGIGITRYVCEECGYVSISA